MKAYNDLWTIAVHAQVEEFKSAATEGRKPDYIAAVVKEVEQTHSIETPETQDPVAWVRKQRVLNEGLVPRA